ncbi:MAG TPA: helix-turn-helix domain-containing protein, partial [Urbifossiella sp.]|nr:helix-turn-helix domain-containing protein [Urbifossiella sp.]
MAWLRITLTDAEQAIVDAERDAHVRRQMLVLRLLHCGVTRAQAAEVAGLGRATVQRSVAADREGGLDGLRRWDRVGPVSD